MIEAINRITMAASPGAATKPAADIQYVRRHAIEQLLIAGGHLCPPAMFSRALCLQGVPDDVWLEASQAIWEAAQRPDRALAQAAQVSWAAWEPPHTRWAVYWPDEIFREHIRRQVALAVADVLRDTVRQARHLAPNPRLGGIIAWHRPAEVEVCTLAIPGQPPQLRIDLQRDAHSTRWRLMAAAGHRVRVVDLPDAPLPARNPIVTACLRVPAAPCAASVAIGVTAPRMAPQGVGLEVNLHVDGSLLVHQPAVLMNVSDATKEWRIGDYIIWHTSPDGVEPSETPNHTSILVAGAQLIGHLAEPGRPDVYEATSAHVVFRHYHAEHPEVALPTQIGQTLYVRPISYIRRGHDHE